EALLLAQMREEQAALDSARRTLLDQQRVEYIAQIKSAVENKWIRPADLRKGLKTEVQVSQIPGGVVTDVTVTISSGNVAFDRSVVNAIRKASPLPLPKDPALFTRNLQFEFDPED
ncbi:MAG TPA: cell envelope integrity protein TolA, partial [Gammaproteobacteria bacterium]